MTVSFTGHDIVLQVFVTYNLLTVKQQDYIYIQLFYFLNEDSEQCEMSYKNRL